MVKVGYTNSKNLPNLGGIHKIEVSTTDKMFTKQTS